MAETAESTLSTLGDMVARLRARGDHEAVVEIRDGACHPITSADLAGRIYAVAAALRRDGLEAGEVVGVCGPPSANWIAAALGIIVAGGVWLSIDEQPTYPLSELLADAGCRQVFTTADLAERFAFLAERGGRTRDLDDPTDGIGMADAAGLPALDPSAPAVIYFTSGTTGKPKGFHLTHRNLVASITMVEATGLATARDRALVPLPLHHVYASITGTITGLTCGTTIILPEALTGPGIREAFQAANPTMLVAVPRLYETLTEGILGRVLHGGLLTRLTMGNAMKLSMWTRRRFGWRLGRVLMAPVRRRLGPSLKVMVSGGAHLREETFYALEALGFTVLSGWGLSETSSVFSVNQIGARKDGSAGRPLGDGEVRITQPNEDGIGEIEVRGSVVTSGYLNNEQANRDSFTEDGWFKTGDRGIVDPDGFIFIRGRLKELIILSGGENVNPEMVETAYLESERIEEIGVLEYDGQLVALVRPNRESLRGDGSSQLRVAMRVALTEIGRTLASHHRLAGFELTDEPLPRTRLGKLQRFKLPERYAAAKARGGVSEEGGAGLTGKDFGDPESAKAFALVRARFPDRRLERDTSLFVDLGMDSFDWMNLVVEAEDGLGIAIDSERMHEVDTIDDFITLCTTSPNAAAKGKASGRYDAERWTRPLGPFGRFFNRFFITLNRWFWRWWLRLSVEGAENLPSGAATITPNHVSDIDAFVTSAALPPSVARRAAWAGTPSRLFNSAVMRGFSRLARIFPVEDRRPDEAVANARRVLDRGDVQLWYPEGWRSPDGTLMDFSTGIGRLIIETGTVVVPAHIDGTFAAMPRGRRWPRRVRTTVRFGQPVTGRDLLGREPEKGDEQAIADALKARVAALVPDGTESG
ncbi:MAG: AMP-binding protein [Azospirillaceae bacterium]